MYVMVILEKIQGKKGGRGEQGEGGWGDDKNVIGT
jgi:hypothetical protein